MGTKAHGGTFQLSGNVQNRPTGLAYDAAGNLTSYLSSAYVYDQENRLSSAAGMSYTYDANGERVLKSNTSTGAAVKRYWSMGGNTLAEGDLSGNLTAEYIYFGGRRVARIDLPANTVHYYLSDHLGSTSIIASAAGAVEEESDYYPFGTEVVVTGGVNELKFAGKRRDTESQLSYFGARNYANGLARFITPDWAFKPASVPYADLKDPQSLNLYSYVQNRPTVLVDLDGHDDGTKTHKPQTTTYASTNLTYGSNITATQITTTTTPNADGTTTMSSTTTTATYSVKDGEEGKALGFTTSSSSTTFSADGKVISASNDPSHNISAGDAGKLMTAFGGSVGLSGLQQTAHGDALSKFPGEVAEDLKTHPFRNLGRALIIGFLIVDPPTTPLGVAAAVSTAATDLGSSLNGEDK
jgi:RHS repeat-associated protein